MVGVSDPFEAHSSRSAVTPNTISGGVLLLFLVIFCFISFSSEGISQVGRLVGLVRSGPANTARPSSSKSAEWHESNVSIDTSNIFISHLIDAAILINWMSYYITFRTLNVHSPTWNQWSIVSILNTMRLKIVHTDSTFLLVFGVQNW